MQPFEADCRGLLSGCLLRFLCACVWLVRVTFMCRALKKYFPDLLELDGAGMTSSLPVEAQQHHLPTEYVEGVVLFLRSRRR